MPDITHCFPPVESADARVLILGSLPSQRSLREQEYYAHPQNAFWRIMKVLAGAEGGYEQRCAALRSNRIALWDVLATSVRPGSMDADIQLDNSQANDFDTFFASHPEILRICFNGKAAARMFERFVGFAAAPGGVTFETLPSTSPAYAAMPYDEKLARWRTALR